MKNTRPTPLVLAILDGWGHSHTPEHNAIAAAATPNFDALWSGYPHGKINASELHVGLPTGQMGNSEVGHMNIGSGRVVMQDLPRIDAAIASGELANHPALLAFSEALKASGGRAHLMGLLSDGGVHAHQNHIAALAKILAAHGIGVLIHAFLDGRDTPPQSAAGYLEAFEASIAGHANISIATLSGRYYAMDRDNRWDRVKQAFDVMTSGYGHHHPNWRSCIDANYAEKIHDEFIVPAAINNYRGMQDGDGILMTNFRADRAREILDALLNPDYTGFPRSRKIEFAARLGMCEYSSSHAKWMGAMFPPEPLTDMLGEIISKAGMKQLRIAETEKYAHVTFFFNGGREEVYPGEERILVPSPKVATYDLKPEMSAPEVTDKLVEAIEAKRFDVIIVNYANTDMVGHTGNMDAAMKAVEAVDSCLGRLWSAVREHGGALIVTADHGNAEQLMDSENDQPHTAHTLNVVPVIIARDAYKDQDWNLPEGRLADIAPTMLSLLGLPQPTAMNGHSLIPK